MFRTLVAASLAAALVSVAASPETHAAEPRARSGEAIILGKDDVIRVSEMSRVQYRMALTAMSRRFERATGRTVYFAHASSKLAPQMRDALDAQATWLNANPTARITVEGYTDASGDEAANRRLAIDRARTVARYLVQRGVDRERLVSITSTSGKRAGRTPAENRRVVTWIVELRDPDIRGGDSAVEMAEADPEASGPTGGTGATGGTGTGSTGSSGGTGSTGGTGTGTGTTEQGNNGKAHGVNGTQPGRNR